MEKKIKYLEMIENIIQRMASNSFQLKGWSVTLVSLIGGLAAAGSDKRFILLAFIPEIAFWFLDSFYLQLERKYKALYKEAVSRDEADIDFSMDTNRISYSAEDAKRICYCRCLFSLTEWLFYLSICAGILLLIVVLKVFP